MLVYGKCVNWEKLRDLPQMLAKVANFIRTYTSKQNKMKNTADQTNKQTNDEANEAKYDACTFACTATTYLYIFWYCSAFKIL